MVKPPKTMEPESVDLSKAGRGSGKAFQDDSFRNHMARKIDLQRKQFGLVIPPDPSPMQESTQHPTLENETTKPSHNQHKESATVMSGRGFGDDSFRNYMARKIDMQRKQFGLVIPPDPRLMDDETVQPQEDVVKPRRLAVRFADDVKGGSNDTSMRNTGDGTDMASILKRLKRKYGKRSARLRRKRRREEPEASSEETSVVYDDNDRLKEEGTPVSSFALEETVEVIPQVHSSPRKRRPDLFFIGVVVLVNGYTNPDVETLQRLLQKHGGDLEKYETSRVTHIIAEHLSSAKAKIYKQRKRPIPVCYPTWIIDSVDAGRLIPHGNYLIQEVQDDNAGKKTVKSFFGASAKTVENAELSQQHQPSQPAVETTSKSCHSPFSYTDDRANPDDLSCLTGKGIGTTGICVDDELEQRSTLDSNAVNMGRLQDDESLSNQPSQSKMESFPHLQPTLIVVSSDNCQQVAALDGGRAAPTCQSVKEVDDCNEIDNENILQNSKSQSTELPSHKKGSAGHQLERETREEPFASEDPGLVTNDKYIKGRIRTVGNDPMFLESFFSSSRLSFIGSYKQRIQKSTAKQDQTCRNPSKGDHRFVFHIDMDCFFASVVLRNYPEYRNLPVAISHHGKRGDGADKQNVVSKNSTSECATCNYEARKYGITKGMYLGRAKELCPELVVLYYDFEGYEEVSEQVAEILQRQAFAFNGSVEQVSCDEAYVELFIPPDAVSGTSFELAGEIAEGIRQEIFSETQCTASVGVGANKLLAKLATDKVKPNGSFVVRDYRELLKSLRLRDLHGVGYRMDRRLSDEGLNCVSDVWDLGDRAEGTLCRILGAGLGKRILHFCKGEDDRPVKPVERKTIGAECNYGVRFDGAYGVEHMVTGLAKEVERRMQAVGVRGSRVTLKVKQRKQGAKPPPKFLGHGSCHNLSKSLDVQFNSATRDWTAFTRIGNFLFNEMKVPPDDVRGMGIVVSKLVFDDKHEVDCSTKQGLAKWLEGSPHKVLGDSQGDGRSPKENKEEADEEATPRKVSVSFAPTTLLRSFKEGEVIEIEQDLSPPAAVAPVHQPWLVDDSSPSDQSESSLLSSPLVDRLGCKSNSARTFDKETSDEHNAERGRDGFRTAGSNTTATVAEVQSPDCNDFVLPPLSQIRMSQVEFLPSPLRKTIKDKVEVAKRGSAAVVYFDQDQAPSRPTTDDIANLRLRQVSVKRMLKLAAVKSRVEKLSDRLGDAVSLTQLESLSLEMQLQIANNDDLDVGVLSPEKKQRTKRKNSGMKHIPETDQEQGGVCMEHKHCDVVVLDEEVEPLQSAEDVDSDYGTICGDMEAKALGSEDSRAFYRDNIVPLQMFLNENFEANDDSVNQVKDFLCLCVSENRHRDAVLLLRSIRSRSDEAWSRTAYATILDAVNERCMQMLGSFLDVDWLGLRPPTML